MNGPEKKVFILAICLFALGLAVRLSPWDPVPQIEEFSYAEESRETTFVRQPDKALPKVELPAKSKGKRSRKAKPAVRFPIAINRATVGELCAIKGVGPKLAEKIVAYRTLHGRFAGPGDLKKVAGIGKKKAEMILAFVVFD